MGRYHHQNLTDGKLPLWRFGRAWWWKLGWEWRVFHGSWHAGIALGLKHFSVRFLRCAFYLHHRDHEGFEPREFSVSVHDGNVWIEHPWIRGGGEWRRDDPWWKKQIVLHVVDWLIGKSRCTHTEGTPFETVVPMPEGSYRAIATPETFVWRRRWYWPTKRRESVTLDIPGGIPFAGKGENSWDCGDDGLWGCGGDTVEKAIGYAVSSVLERRRKRGHDSKDTGKVPAIVLNPEAV